VAFAVEIGLISDTHGQVRRRVHTALAGVQLILHAGDVGGNEVLDELALIAPVRAVRGNTDPPDARLPHSLVHDFNGRTIHVSHGHELGAPMPEALLARYDADVVVYGHTHVALVQRAGERLVVNPGAAGPARFDHVPSVARLSIDGEILKVEIVPLV
jgi:putative phosphoesterase